MKVKPARARELGCGFDAGGVVALQPAAGLPQARRIEFSGARRGRTCAKRRSCGAVEPHQRPNPARCVESCRRQPHVAPGSTRLSGLLADILRLPCMNPSSRLIDSVALVSWVETSGGLDCVYSELRVDCKSLTPVARPAVTTPQG